MIQWKGTLRKKPKITAGEIKTVTKKTLEDQKHQYVPRILQDMEVGNKMRMDVENGIEQDEIQLEKSTKNLKSSAGRTKTLPLK